MSYDDRTTSEHVLSAAAEIGSWGPVAVRLRLHPATWTRIEAATRSFAYGKAPAPDACTWMVLGARMNALDVRLDVEVPEDCFDAEMSDGTRVRKRLDTGDCVEAP